MEKQRITDAEHGTYEYFTRGMLCYFLRIVWLFHIVQHLVISWIPSTLLLTI
jgi:hypothetical protein